MKIRLSKMAVTVGRSFSHGLQGTTEEGQREGCKEEDEFSLRCHSDLEVEHLGRKLDMWFLSGGVEEVCLV